MLLTFWKYFELVAKACLLWAPLRLNALEIMSRACLNQRLSFWLFPFRLVPCSENKTKLSEYFKKKNWEINFASHEKETLWVDRKYQTELFKHAAALCLPLSGYLL